MVSLIENIDTSNVDDADDSDAPIEVTTKTSKDEKKKKKKKNKTKRHIQYTLATEQDDHPNKKRIDEESALTHLVFGDDDDYLGEITSKAETHKRTDTIKTDIVTVESKKPAWIDTEEVTEEIVREPNFNQICPRKRQKITTGEYEKKLKFEYERVMGRPAWAEKLLNKNNEEEDSDEELFRRTGNYLTKSTVLRAGTIDCLRCADFKHDVAHSKLLRSVEFHPSARILLTAGRSQYLNLYQVDGKKNERIQSLFFERFSIDTTHFTQDGNQVIVTGDRNFFKVYDMIEGKIMQIPMMRGFEERLGKFELSPDGSLIVFINRNGQLHFVSAKSKELIDTTQISGNINSITFRHDSELMFVAGDEGIVTVFDVRRRAAIHRFVDDGSFSTTSMCVSPNQQYFITGQKSGIVNVYSYDDVLKSGEPKPIKYLKNLTTPIQNVKINSSSELLAINSYHLSRAIRLVHMPTLTVYDNFPEFHDKKIQIVNTLDFSPNSGFLTMGNNNGKVLLYRLKHYTNY
ncbi:unnamed protein product [Rotaria socialis]|uniref:U3 small nucleolar RNA-associated protein 18-like protein n=1 Tax=Rotaria socialis TaxID=392032 RepID=A0A818D399_9BILA|nr:unnamed protein product [Rotaria socialis]CAF3401398.1 unnamed protein product [Rotaria socialis]CAF3427711.1 unnamed protein product [Rotaria socialis]CAF3438648.1 unnamed protein product [Rotaria socialis]CAF3609822.1 unnamed protein product [Rotaria socialis]